MNTPNPLVPQGTAPAGGKSTVRIAVLTILVVHVALIGGMLIQGCSKETPNKSASEDPATSTAMATNEPYYPTDTNVQPVAATDAVSTAASSTSSVPAFGSNAAVTTVATPVTAPVTAPAPIAIAPTPTAGGDYTVVSKDTFAIIAKKHGISVKALEAANLGVDPRKLKVGQKLTLPAAATATTAAADSSAPVAAVEGGSVYTVKAGDVLARIAKTHHTTVKAIVAANNLKSQNSLKVGQKLKMPAPKAAIAPAVPAITEPAPVSTAAAPVASPLTPAPAVNN